MTKLNGILRSTVFLLGNGLVIAAVYALAYAPVRDHFLRQEELIAKRQILLAQMKELASQAGAADAAQSQTVATGGELHSGSSEGVILADLQTKLKTLAQQAGVQLRVLRGLPSRVSGASTYIGAQMDVVGTIRQIAQLIQMTEAHRPYLFVTAANFRTSATHMVVPADNREPMIELLVDVVAPTLKPGSSP